MRRALRLLALAAAGAAALGAGEEPAHVHGGASGEQAHVHGDAAALEGDAPAGDSLYQLEGDWTAAGGRTTTLAALAGEPVVLLLFYGTCQSVCPILVRDVQRVEAALAPTERERVRFVLVTIDPEVDSPERLAAYAAEHGLAPERWTLLHGSPEQVRELAAAIGFRYRPIGNGQYAHTQRITLLDRAGRAVAHWDGVGRDSGEMAARVRQEIAPEAQSGTR